MFGLDVRAELPIGESFGSTVLRFVATDGKQYIIKKPFALNKGQREAEALRALSAHPHTPALLDYREVDGAGYLLIEGLDGTNWANPADATPKLLRDIGEAMWGMHQVSYDSFAGQSTWRDLLVFNMNRYCDVIGIDDAALAAAGRELFERHLESVPASDTAVLVHFDLRPGNILIDDNNQLVALIDFDACRGGHASMDFFKFWQQVAPVSPGSLEHLSNGYAQAGRSEPWMEPSNLNALMTIYSAYHGVAGLSWCYVRDDFSGSFPTVNRNLIRSALAVLT